MYIFSGILNIIAGLIFAWRAFGGDILLAIPALIFIANGIMCIAKEVKKK